MKYTKKCTFNTINLTSFSQGTHLSLFKHDIMCLDGVLKYNWYITFPQGLLKHCYSESLKKPLIWQAEGSSSYTIESDTLRKAKQDITVVVYGRSHFTCKLYPFFWRVNIEWPPKWLKSHLKMYEFQCTDNYISKQAAPVNTIFGYF